MREIVIDSNNAKKKNAIIAVSVIILFIILAPRFFFIISKFTHHNQSPLPIQTQANVLLISPVPRIQQAPHIEGTQFIDASGNPVLLHGTVVSSPLSNMIRWKHNENPLDTLNPNTFQAISAWHMNTVRLPISQWVYEASPSAYASILDRAIQNAHEANLYVILSFTDSSLSGSPYKDNMLHAESIGFWKTLAEHYKNDQMLLFEPMDNPSYPDWITWLHGNNLTVRGYQDIIDTIRSTGANQPIIVSPSLSVASSSAGWQSYPETLHDPNIIYALSSPNIISGNEQIWNAAWGMILQSHPIYYSSWDISPVSSCQGLTSDNADTIINTFLTYAEQIHVSWTAGDFSPGQLIQNYTDYTPTSFTTIKPWTCGSFAARKTGMGEVLKSYLIAH